MPLRQPRGTTLLSEIFQHSPADAWRILREEGLRRQRSRYRHNPDVWGVEVGIREVGGELREQSELCLKIYVFRKGFPTYENRVAPWTTVKTATYGRVAFRTDVEPLGVSYSQAVTRVPAPEVEAGKEKGSGFYVVEIGERRFLLSAGHVLQGEPADGGPIRWEKGASSGGGRLVRQSGTFWPLWQDDQENLAAPADLALAEIGTGDRLGPYGAAGQVPEAEDAVSWEEAPSIDTVQICGKHGIVGARFSARIPIGFPIVVGLNTVFYWRLLRYRLVGASTQGGDSGAPIIDNASGRLVGMHVAFLEAGEPLRSYSLALCAGDIVERLGLALGLPVRLRLVGP